MPPASLDRVKSIQDFPTLVAYLRDDLDWPIDAGDVDDVSFDYDAGELELDEQATVKVRAIKEVRPLVNQQPWGVFYLEFEPKRLPIVVLRRILRALVFKKRASAGAARRAAWHAQDLLFISALGEGDYRGMSFAHFRDEGDGQPILQTFSWDQRETHFHYLRLDLERLRWPTNPRDSEAWRQQWSAAFRVQHGEVIATAKDLSLRLAELARRTRDLVCELYRYELPGGPLHQLHTSFRTVLVHDLDVDGFADMVAQTIAYGLFSARVSGEQVLGLAHLESMIPNTNPFLKELFAELTRLGGQGRGKIDFDELGVAELVTVLNQAHIDAVLEDFGRQTRGGREDPVIHFYESFLAAYDKQQKVQRGVFYTPKPVVSYIVRSVDYLLRTELGCPDGLADTSTMEWHGQTFPKVMILDPATGTGTFLEEVIDIIYATMRDKWRKEGRREAEMRDLWNRYVPGHLLPRLHGFELMAAPYAVAHMKLGLKLKETGYDFRSPARLRVFLTNTLERPTDQRQQPVMIPGFLAHESEDADRVKQFSPITVIVGNPPYSAISANLSPLMRNIVDIYRIADGKPIRERSMLQFEKNIQDDYVKFIATTQEYSARAPFSIVGLVTNHSFFDGPTLRGLRWNLLTAYEQLRLTNLHGNTNKREQSPDGGKDENVFDIQQGVAVSILLRQSSDRTLIDKASVHYADLWGTRDAKYVAVSSSIASTLCRTVIHPVSPYYFLTPRSSEHTEEWRSYVPVVDAFLIYSTGTETGFDELLIAFDKKRLIEKIERFTDPSRSIDDIRREYGIIGGHAEYLLYNRGAFDVKNAEKYVVQLQFRPFDYRYVYAKKELLKTNSFNVMRALGPNRVGMVTTRQTKERFGAFVSQGFCGHKCISSYDRSYVLPLWLQNQGLLPESTKQTALRPEFISRLLLATGAASLGGQRYSTEEVFHYIIAILNSNSYRSRYADEIKSEFPRIPLTDDLDLFMVLARCGADISALCLLFDAYALASWNIDRGKRSPFEEKVIKVGGIGPFAVDRGYPIFRQGRVNISGRHWLEVVPEEVWAFHVGGFQVCEKWLKDRVGRTLTPDDIAHYDRVVVAIRETIRLMGEIDEVIEEHGGWPLPGSTSDVQLGTPER